MAVTNIGKSFLILILCCIVQISTGNSKGHLQPLGSHKPPAVVIDEFTTENAPRPQEFYEHYVKLSKAAVFRGAVTESRSYNLWTDQYIRKNFGDMEVRLEGKHEKRHMPPIGETFLGRDNLRHFVNNYHYPNDNTYVISDLPTSMYSDTTVIPSLGACGEMSSRIVEVNLWWSGGGTSSILHKDAYHQINCLMNGTKYWKLIENKYEKNIHKHPEPENEQGGFSDIDPTAVDMIEHPNIAKIEWSNITLNAGDCLFLPKSYYHQVASSGTHNLAVSLLFGRFDRRNSLDFSDCTEATDYKKLISLSEFDVQLLWKGKGTMVMGRADLEDQIRDSLLKHTEKYEKEGKICDLQAGIEMHREMIPDDQNFLGEFSKAFEVIDKNSDGVISSEEVRGLTLDELRRIGDEIDIDEPSNSYTFEYSIVPFESVWWAVKYYLGKHDILNRETWLRGYVKLGGTEDRGMEIFNRLSGGTNDIVSESVTKDRVWSALENWRKYWAPQYSVLPDRPEENGDDTFLQKMWEKGRLRHLEYTDERDYKTRERDVEKDTETRQIREEL